MNVADLAVPNEKFKCACEKDARQACAGEPCFGEYEPQAFLSTNPEHTSLQMLSWFVRRWRREVTFEEARAHLGVETRAPVE